VIEFDQFFTQIDTNSTSLDFTDVFDEVSDLLCNSHRGFFDAQADPNGNSWVPLSPVTIRRKGHAIILIETDAMRESVISRSSPSHVERFDTLGMEWGTNDKKGPFHQFGTMLIPQRQFVGWDDETINSAVGLIADDAVKQLLSGI